MPVRIRVWEHDAREPLSRANVQSADVQTHKADQQLARDNAAGGFALMRLHCTALDAGRKSNLDAYPRLHDDQVVHNNSTERREVLCGKTRRTNLLGVLAYTLDHLPGTGPAIHGLRHADEVQGRVERSR